jgi:iron complex outermembrane receptor protein
VGNPVTVATEEQSVAIYVDDVYIPSSFSASFDFNNIERVEVLKGPQGTLFGRNATGGVINVVTRDPTPQAEIRAEVGCAAYGGVKVRF